MAAWVNITFDAALFSAQAGTWTVASGDVTTLAFRIIGKTLQFAWHVVTTTVSGLPAALWITIPVSRVAKYKTGVPITVINAGTAGLGYAETVAASNVIWIYRESFTAWSNATDTTGTSGELEFEVD